MYIYIGLTSSPADLILAISTASAPGVQTSTSTSYKGSTAGPPSAAAGPPSLPTSTYTDSSSSSSEDDEKNAPSPSSYDCDTRSG